MLIFSSISTLTLFFLTYLRIFIKFFELAHYSYTLYSHLQGLPSWWIVILRLSGVLLRNNLRKSREIDEMEDKFTFSFNSRYSCSSFLRLLGFPIFLLVNLYIILRVIFVIVFDDFLFRRSNTTHLLRIRVELFSFFSYHWYLSL